jgi:hypothetical protein
MDLMVNSMYGTEKPTTLIEQRVRFPVSQMIWSCITSKGVGRLTFISSTVNAERYIHTLEEYLKPVIRGNFQQTQNYIF